MKKLGQYVYNKVELHELDEYACGNQCAFNDGDDSFYKSWCNLFGGDLHNPLEEKKISTRDDPSKKIPVCVRHEKCIELIGF